MLRAHLAQAEWTPTRILTWAEKLGPATLQLADEIVRERSHPEQGFRSCLWILRLAKRYGDDRVEAACLRALGVRARFYRHVESILKRGLDRTAPTDAEIAPPPIHHDNVRGRGYYH